MIKNKLAEIMKKKREEKEHIKKVYVDSGMHDNLMAKVKEKSKSSIKPEDLPF